MSNRTLIITIIIILAVAVGGVVLARMRQAKDSGQGVTMPQQQTPVTADNQKPTSQSCVRNYDANLAKTAQLVIKNRQVQMQVKDFGTIQVTFYDQDAPKTVENFLRLVNAGYYNCLTFHRVAKGFVIQSGDPTGTGSGGDSAFGGAFADELNANTPSYKAGYVKGVLAMANAGPNTNTSQFFIMLDTLALPHNYTIFGKVVAGQDVVDRIGQVPITPELGPNDGKPVTPVVITSMTINK